MIRFSRGTGEIVVGRVLAIETGTLRLAVISEDGTESPRDFPLVLVTEVERRDMLPQTGRFARGGALIGVGAGVLLGGAAATDGGDIGAGAGIIFPIMGAVAGMAIGAVIGSFTVGEAWIPTAMPEDRPGPRLDLFVLPGRPLGLGVRIPIRFGG